jgi:hypothetical protein
MMSTWTCPKCGRSFDRKGQTHECAPAMTLDEYLSAGPPHERPVVEAVLAHIRSLGPVTIEPVSVGVLVKARRTFVELRPMSRWEAVWFVLPRRVEHPRIARVMRASNELTSHAVNARSADDIDEQVRDWLSEAYLSSRAD